MTRYISVYRCRLCGEKFETVGTTNKNLAEKIMARVANPAQHLPGSEPPPDLDLYSVHHCESGGIGLADFEGFAKIGDPTPWQISHAEGGPFLVCGECWYKTKHFQKVCPKCRTRHKLPDREEE